MKKRTFPFARCIALLLICSLLMGMSGRNGELIRGQVFRDGLPADSVAVHENEKIELTLDPGADSYRWEMSRNGVDWENIPHADARILPVTTEMTAQGPLLIRARICVDAEETVTPTVKVFAAPVFEEQESASEAADAEEAAPEGENAGIPEEAIPEEENNTDAQKSETDALTEDNTPAEAEAPTEGEETPAEEAEAPTEGEETPAEETEAPTEGKEAPTEEAEPPTEGEETPAEEAEAPTEGEEAPTEEAETPTEGEEAPTEEAETPTGGEEAPTEEAKIPAEGEAPAEEPVTPAGETAEDGSEKKFSLEEVVVLTAEGEGEAAEEDRNPEESEEPETPEEPEAPENGDTPGMGSFLADLLGGDPAPEEPTPARPRLKLFGAGGGGSSNTVYASSYYPAVFNSTNGNLGTKCVYFDNANGDPYLVLHINTNNYNNAISKIDSISINGLTVWDSSYGAPSPYSGSLTVNVVPSNENYSFTGSYFVCLKLDKSVATEEMIIQIVSTAGGFGVPASEIEVTLNYSGTKEVSVDGGTTYSDSAVVEPGMQPIYRLTVYNDTDSTMPVTDAYLKDVMPAGLFDENTIEYSADGSSWMAATLGSDHGFVLQDNINLAAGDSLTYYVRATVKTNPAPGDYQNTLLFGGDDLLLKQAHATLTVLKTRADYTVKYYKGAVSTANHLGSATQNGKIGDPITVSGGTDEGQLDWKKPAAGYGAGVLQDTSVTVAEDGSSVVRVLYPELEATITYVAVGNGSVTSPSETIPCVTGTASGSTAVPDTGKRFIGWYSDSACTVLLTATETFTPGKGTDGLYHDATYYAKFEADLSTLTITKSGMASGEKAVFTVSDGAGTSFRIAVPGNGGSVTVTGVTVGKTYTVTEDTGWSWRYTATSASQSVTIPTTGGTVEFSNTQSNIYGLDDSTSRENKYNNG